MISRLAPSSPIVLLTGFEPFGGESINPSWLLAQSMHGQTLAGHRIEAIQLPTVFGASAQVLRQAIRKHRPTWVVCLGQAGGRSAIGFERVAINVDEARIADNAGQQPCGPIAARGPVAYWSTLPIHAMAHACEQAGVRAEVSNSAGTFVCNHVFYQLMRMLARSRPAIRGGFVHVPYLPEQGEPYLTLAQMQRGLSAALVAALTGKTTGARSGALH